MRASGLCPMVRIAGDGKDAFSVLSTNDGGSRSGSEPFHSRLPLRSLWWKIRKLPGFQPVRYSRACPPCPCPTRLRRARRPLRGPHEAARLGRRPREHRAFPPPPEPEDRAARPRRVLPAALLPQHHPPQADPPDRAVRIGRCFPVAGPDVSPASTHCQAPHRSRGAGSSSWIAFSSQVWPPP